MAKKPKRRVSTVAPRTSGAETASREFASPRPGSSADFNPDYSYVITDLKKIGIMAVIFISILIILSFIL